MLGLPTIPIFSLFSSTLGQLSLYQGLPLPVCLHIIFLDVHVLHPVFRVPLTSYDLSKTIVFYKIMLKI